jgi:hypothetical protein
LRASRRTATGEIVRTAILRDAVLRTAPQDEVRGIKFHPFRYDWFHGIDSLIPFRPLPTRLFEDLVVPAGQVTGGRRSVVDKVAE